MKPSLETKQILEAYHDKEANRQIGRNEERERIMEILKPCFDYCREQNGIAECKNCSLSMELFKPHEDSDEEMWEGSRTSAEERAGNPNERD